MKWLVRNRRLSVVVDLVAKAEKGNTGKDSIDEHKKTKKTNKKEKRLADSEKKNWG